MSIDTANKRRSVSSMPWSPMMPVPDGAITAPDRGQVAGYYMGILATSMRWEVLLLNSYITQAMDLDSGINQTLALDSGINQTLALDSAFDLEAV